MRLTLLVQKRKLPSNPCVMGFRDGSVGKESACDSEDTGDAGWTPGSGRSPGEGNGNPLQCSSLENVLQVDKQKAVEGMAEVRRTSPPDDACERGSSFLPVLETKAPAQWLTT